jgi:hypothetical protein
VFDSLKGTLASKGGAMATIAGAIDILGRGALAVAASVGAAALIAALTETGVGVVVGVVLAEQLIELLYDMPDDIGNQVCNSFAFDCHRGFPSDGHCLDAAGTEIRDVDSDNWSTAPGDGHAVSPDNIHMFWDAPGSSDAPEMVRASMDTTYPYNSRARSPGRRSG